MYSALSESNPNLLEDRGGVETRLAYELDIILLRVRGSASHGGDDCGGEDDT